MEVFELDLLNRLSFKTKIYRKNFDLINNDDNFISECDGKISEMRALEMKPPLIIGEYHLSVWNFGLAKEFNVDLNKLMFNYSSYDTYSELIREIKNGDLNINDFNKILFIHTLILNKKYRKRGVTEEFIEMLYRDFYDDKTLILMYTRPIQDNKSDFEHFIKYRQVRIQETFTETNYVSARDYYSINELTKKTDGEINEYKLYGVANKCGFDRIGESYLFTFSPEKIKNRLRAKRRFSENSENE